MVPPCSDRISRVPPYSRIDWSGRIRGYHPLWPAFPDRSACIAKATGLLRVRSPLLAESLLMSFPPGTEMFQFPGFASAHYGFMYRYPCGWVAPFGYPRINACSRLPMAFRSVPRPSSPPGAKASTECPSHARSACPPCTETILRRWSSAFNLRSSESRLQAESPSSYCPATGDRVPTTVHRSSFAQHTTGPSQQPGSKPAQTQ